MSFKVTEVRGIPLGLVNTNVMVLVPPAMIGLGAIVLVSVGATAVTTRSAVAALLLGASSEVTAWVRLVCVPTVEELISTVMVQLALARIEPPANTALVPLAAAVTVPLQVLVCVAAAELVIAVG